MHAETAVAPLCHATSRTVRGSGGNRRAMRTASRTGRVLWLIAAIVVLLAGCAGPFDARTTHPAQRRSTPGTQAGGIVVGPNVDVSQAAGSQDEVSAAVDPDDPAILLAGSNSLQQDPSVRVYSSGDAGLHWSAALLPLPATAKAQGAVDQWAAIGPDHRQAMAYLAFGQVPQRGGGLGGLTLFVATRSGPNASWQAPSTPVGGLPPQGVYDDKPTLVADNGPASPFRGRLYVAWTRWVGQNGWLFVSRSADWGHTWSSPLALRQQGDNWGAALADAADGSVVVAWAGSDHLWISRSHDGGGTFSTPLAFGACTAPMSGCVGGANIAAQSDAGVRANPALVAMPATGGQPAQALAIYATGDGSHTHIELARFDEASLHPLGAPVLVPIGQPGTDQFLPAAAYDPSDRTLWVCTYTSLAEAAVETRYTCSASLDGGVTFRPPAAVASVTSNEEQPGAFRNFIGRQYGDYTAVVVAAGVAHVFWTDSRELASLGEEIFTATIKVNDG